MGEGVREFVDNLFRRRGKMATRFVSFKQEVNTTRDVNRLFKLNLIKQLSRTNPIYARKRAQVLAAKANKERRQRIQETGAPSTIKTSRMGLLDEAPTRKKTLLGGL